MKQSGQRVVVQSGMQASGAPGVAYLRRCARAALADASGEVVIRIVDEPESAELNERYREGRGATNVLAFPAGEGAELDDAGVAHAHHAGQLLAGAQSQRDALVLLRAQQRFDVIVRPDLQLGEGGRRAGERRGNEQG